MCTWHDAFVSVVRPRHTLKKTLKMSLLFKDEEMAPQDVAETVAMAEALCGCTLLMLCYQLSYHTLSYIIPYPQPSVVGSPSL